MAETAKKAAPAAGLAKCPTGIQGLDEITGGGLPRGRTVLVCGGPGCGKTLFALEFLVRGATEYGEPGLFVSFEESPEELAANVASLGWDLGRLQADGLFLLDHVLVDRSEIEETGAYDLEGLFIRLGYAIDSVGAKRVVLDTVESLFAALPNEAILRSELRRLFRWLKEKGVTALITGERGDATLTRHGLEEYVSDCVVTIDHRVHDEVTTRRLRIVKYRGSLHGTNEYPYLIGDTGISVLPVTSLGLDYPVSAKRVSTGLRELDDMLGGEGWYRGSSVLVSGTAGTGKTSLAAHFTEAACGRGERCLYFAFEESVPQILRNMGSIGIDLAPWETEGLLRFHAARPTLHGLERHLLIMHDLVSSFEPAVVVVDPISNLVEVGDLREVKSLLTRFVDFLKGRGVTSLFTDLTPEGAPRETTQVGVSSLMDAWLLVRQYEAPGERNRGLYILKARGMAHSNQVRELFLTAQGATLADVYAGPEGVLMGSARAAQEARERAEEREALAAEARRGQASARKAAVLRTRIAALQAELEEEEERTRSLAGDAEQRRRTAERDRE